MFTLQTLNSSNLLDKQSLTITMFNPFWNKNTKIEFYTRHLQVQSTVQWISTNSCYFVVVQTTIIRRRTKNKSTLQEHQGVNLPPLVCPFSFRNSRLFKVFCKALWTCKRLDSFVMFNGVFFSTKKKCTLFQKIKIFVCFLKMFRPLKGWYVLF